MVPLPGLHHYCVLVLLLFSSARCAIEPGKMSFEFHKKEGYGLFPKSLYKAALVSISGRCSYKNLDKPPVLKIEGYLKYSGCAEAFNGIDEDHITDEFLENQLLDYQLKFGPELVDCDKHIKFKDMTHLQQVTLPPTVSSTPPLKSEDGEVNLDQKKSESSVLSSSSEVVEPASTSSTFETATSSSSSQTTSPSKTVSEKASPSTSISEKPSFISVPARQKLESPPETQETNTQETDTQESDTQETDTQKTESQETESQETESQEPESQEPGSQEPETHKTETKETKTIGKAPETAGQAPGTKKHVQKTNGATANEPEQMAKNPAVSDSHRSKGKILATGDTAGGLGSRKKRSDEEIMAPKKNTTVKPTSKQKKSTNAVFEIKVDGVYLLVIHVSVDNGLDDKNGDGSYSLTLDVSMKNKIGYLSAADWPLLPFYGAMSLLYLTYGLVWLVISACYWRDILRIQFWIGGVIALGMLEKAIFYSEYSKLNHEGVKTGSSLLIFAEIVSSFKRTLARILILIVSMGFGIVRPRLGSTLHKVLGVGFVYFILATIEGSYRTVTPTANPSREQLIARIPLAVLDSAICWWIFMSLVQTTRTLRIRRNTIKLSLYRHFTNTLIFAVLASLAYMIYSIKVHTFSDCIDDWAELWFDEAFWHFLFSLILLVIMILWRPSANNQRYAFTPLVDLGEEDDEDNITLSEAFEGMKLRNTKNPSAVPDVKVNGDSKRTKAEDDLKWVEENIPTSGDIALPSLMDSDEELMTTKFEISKME